MAEFLPTIFDSAWLVIPGKHSDNRGFFARTWCRKEFSEFKLKCDFDQCSVSLNVAAGTIRGMHFQTKPFAETKLIRCTRGKIFDVIVDLRVESETFGKYQSFELSSENHHAVYAPAGFAHGFQTLAPNTEVYYQISGIYKPEAASGFHHADPKVGIPWPQPVSVISLKDETLKTLAQGRDPLSQ